MRTAKQRNDLAFLQEMLERFNRARAGSDTTEFDMVRKMMEDWIDELERD